MPEFSYTALDGAGRRIAGVLTAATEQAVLSELESRRLTPVLVAQKAARAPRRRRISSRRLGTAYSQLGELTGAGVPILRALRLIGSGKANARVAQVFGQLAEEVSQGEDLATAMAERAEVFPKIHIAMVRAGEKGGFLEGVLARLGQHVLSQAELKSRVIGSLIYPTLLVLFGTLVLGVIFGFFIPMFRPLFERIEEPLPLITRVVFGLSTLVGKYGVVTGIVIAVVGVAAFRLSKRSDVRRQLAVARNRIPLVGSLTRGLAAARFCRMLGTMLANGVPMLSAMQIAREAAGSVLLEEAIDLATESVRAGQPLAPPLGESGLFEEDVVEMIAVGEEAGKLEGVLVSIAQTIEGRVDRTLSTLVRLVEPLMLLAIAMVVVVVAVALILPMTMLSAAV